MLPYQPLKMTLAIKVVKIDSKIIISLPQSKSVKQTVYGIHDRLRYRDIRAGLTSRN
jgi:hypothetical protein